MNVNFLFEASVGGGIPVLRPMAQCLTANEITEVTGILNGTTNFILTKMITENMSFEDALKLAQDLGYAEKDPTADIEGHDTCRKICILASLCFGKHVYPDSVYTEGITKITLDDVAYIGAFGGVIKLLGRAKRMDDGKIFAIVSPAIVMNGSQLASVNDVFNAILVRGDATGDVVFYGKAYKVTCCNIDNCNDCCVIIAFFDNRTADNLTYCCIDNGSSFVVEVALIKIADADTALINGSLCPAF
jgi:homoserine dehydrogenase